MPGNTHVKSLIQTLLKLAVFIYFHLMTNVLSPCLSYDHRGNIYKLCY